MSAVFAAGGWIYAGFCLVDRSCERGNRWDAVMVAGTCLGMFPGRKAAGKIIIAADRLQGAGRRA